MEIPRRHAHKKTARPLVNLFCISGVPSIHLWYDQSIQASAREKSHRLSPLFSYWNMADVQEGE